MARADREDRVDNKGGSSDQEVEQQEQSDRNHQTSADYNGSRRLVLEMGQETRCRREDADLGEVPDPQEESDDQGVDTVASGRATEPAVL